MPDSYSWPPTKEDLGRLYLAETLSAMKIAKVYGLRYKGPKVAESTVLYHLKRNGIRRRNPAEHVRKVTDAMAEEWAKRYQVGESLKDIAAGEFSLDNGEDLQLKSRRPAPNSWEKPSRISKRLTDIGTIIIPA